MLLREFASIVLSGGCVFALGGVVFGFSSLYPLLYREGVFVDDCASVDQCQVSAHQYETTKCCNDQLLDFTLLSTLSFFASDSAMVIYGECIDRLGPKVTFLFSSTVAGVGLFVIGLNASLHFDLLWFAGFIMLGAGGPGVFMGCLIFAEVFPDHRALATSVAASMWDTSSVVFLLFHALYFSFGLSFDTIAYGWLVLSAALATATFCLLPSLRMLRKLRASLLPNAAGTTNTDPLLQGSEPQQYTPRLTPTRLVIDPAITRSNSGSLTPITPPWSRSVTPRVTPTTIIPPPEVVRASSASAGTGTGGGSQHGSRHGSQYSSRNGLISREACGSGPASGLGDVEGALVKRPEAEAHMHYEEGAPACRGGVWLSFERACAGWVRRAWEAA